MAEARGWAGLAIVGADAGPPSSSAPPTSGPPHGADPGHPLRRPGSSSSTSTATPTARCATACWRRSGSPTWSPSAWPTSPGRRPALNPLVGAWPVPTQSAETYLVRRDGDQRALPHPLRFNPTPRWCWACRSPAPTCPPPARPAASGHHRRRRDYRRAPVLAYAAAVAGTPWLMIAEIDGAEAYAGVRTHRLGHHHSRRAGPHLRSPAATCCGGAAGSAMR